MCVLIIIVEIKLRIILLKSKRKEITKHHFIAQSHSMEPVTFKKRCNFFLCQSITNNETNTS